MELPPDDKHLRGSPKHQMGRRVTASLILLAIAISLLATALEEPEEIRFLKQAFFVSWVGLPLLLAVDIHFLKQCTEWSPKTPYWLLGSILPLVHLGVIAAYMLRRTEAMRKRRWQRWYLVALATLILATGGLLVQSVWQSPLFPGTVVEDAGLIGWLSLSMAIPTFVFFDGTYLADTELWNGDPMGWALLTALPGIQLITVPVYLGFRYVEVHR